jgi:hypothetical protein
MAAGSSERILDPETTAVSQTPRTSGHAPHRLAPRITRGGARHHGVGGESFMISSQ